MIKTPKLSRPTHLTMWLLTSVLLLSLSNVTTASQIQSSKPNIQNPATAVSNFPTIGIEAFENTSASFQDMASTGVKFVRWEVYWSEVEPQNTTPPNYNWAAYDQTFARASQAGLTILATIVGCPTWACLRNIGPLRSNMYGEAAQFMGAMSAHYSAAPYNVHYWELWNEPDGSSGPTPGDHSWGWGAFPDKYTQMLQSVYPVIKISDPNAVVVLGGVAYSYFWDEGGPFNRDFLPQVLADGARPYIDAIGFHYYSNDLHYTNIADKAVAIRTALGSAAQGIPFFCTEAGFSSDANFGGTESSQARYIVKLYVWAASSGVQALSWFLYHDFITYDPNQQRFSASGIVRIDDTHKLSYYALQTFTQQVNPAGYLGALGSADGLPATLEGYKYKAPGTDSNVNTWVVWSRSNTTTTLTLSSSLAPSVMRATGLQGDTLPVTSGAGDTLQVSVGPDPVYIKLNYSAPRFHDVPYLYWAYDYVDYLASSDIVGGYSDDTFRPGNPATRGQFSKMDTLGAGWTLLNPSDPTFADVAVGSTFYQYIETAFNHSVIAGYACGGPTEPCDPQNHPYFHQNTNITRAQIAKIIVLSRGWTLLNPSQPTFTDIPFGSTFYQYIETAVAKGIIAGYPCGGPDEPCHSHNSPYFRPGNNATRAQLSKMLALALQQP